MTVLARLLVPFVLVGCHGARTAAPPAVTAAPASAPATPEPTPPEPTLPEPTLPEATPREATPSEPPTPGPHTLVEVVAQIRQVQLDDLAPDQPPSALSETAAHELLCGGTCDLRAPFFSRMIAQEGLLEAHLVVPREGGYWVVPRVVTGNGILARCPDEIREAKITGTATGFHARVVMLVNDWKETDTASWCEWSECRMFELDVAFTTGAVSTKKPKRCKVRDFD